MGLLRLAVRALNNIRLKKVKRRVFPLQIIFFVTNRCNAACPHCFYWQNLNKDNNELTLSEIENLVDILPPLGSIGITGGEPTLREDLLDLCRLFLRKTDSLTIASNGLLPEVIYSVLNKISSDTKKKIHLQLSAEGLKDVHNKFRGEGAFDKVIQTIELVKRLKNVKVILVTTLTKLNIDRIEETVRHFSVYKLEHRFNIVRGIDNSLFNLRKDLINYHNPRNPEEVFLSIQELESTYHKLSALNQIYSFWSGPEQAVMGYSIKILKERKKILRCFAGRLECVLYPNGDVAACEFIKPFANIREFDYDFRKLWLSAQAASHRQMIKDCFCIHSCNLSTALNQTPDFICGILKDKRL